MRTAKRPGAHAVYVEVGRRRAFAASVDWPGWCRGARDEAGALAALAAYGGRYAAAVGGRHGFRAAADASDLEVLERLPGDATTDFGAPGVVPSVDERPLSPQDAERLAALLEAAWAAFDRAADAARGRTLRTGPRGGGRMLPAIVEHVLEADGAYVAKLGGFRPKRTEARTERDVETDMAAVRAAFLRAFRVRAAGDPPPRMPRAGGVWPLPYAVRRSAWHALDHAWEIEDRAQE